MLEYSLALMAKPKSISTNPKLSTPESPVIVAGAVRRLVVTVPILVAVLFTIGYVQLGVQPVSEKSSSQTARQTSKAVPVVDTSTLQIAHQTQEILAPLTVAVTEGLRPTAGDIGDTNASVTAQPTITSLQAPTSSNLSDDTALQAHKRSGDSDELLNL